MDLGCAPGGWLVILSGAVGPLGRVVGLDLAPCKEMPPNVTTVVGDLRDPAVRAAALERLGGPADLVTSDLSPKLTGIRARDQAVVRELLDLSLEVARQALRPGGAMVAKIFMSADFKSIIANFERCFRKVETTRTEATRPGSAELYIIARDFQAEGDSNDGS